MNWCLVDDGNARLPRHLQRREASENFGKISAESAGAGGRFAGIATTTKTTASKHLGKVCGRDKFRRK